MFNRNLYDELFSMLVGIELIDDYIDNLRTDSYEESDIDRTEVLKESIAILVDDLRNTHGIDFYCDLNELTSNFYDAQIIVDLYKNFVPASIVKSITPGSQLDKILRPLLDENVDNILLIILEHLSIIADQMNYYPTERYVFVVDKMKSTTKFNDTLRYLIDNPTDGAVDLNVENYVLLSKLIREQSEFIKPILADLLVSLKSIDISDSETLVVAHRRDILLSKELNKLLQSPSRIIPKLVDKLFNELSVSTTMSDSEIITYALIQVSNEILFNVPVTENDLLANVALYTETISFARKHFPKVSYVDHIRTSSAESEAPLES